MCQVHMHTRHHGDLYGRGSKCAQEGRGEECNGWEGVEEKECVRGGGREGTGLFVQYTYNDLSSLSLLPFTF